LRYTMWIPLYPLGFLCEGVVILRYMFFIVAEVTFDFYCYF